MRSLKNFTSFDKQFRATPGQHVKNNLCETSAGTPPEENISQGFTWQNVSFCDTILLLWPDNVGGLNFYKAAE